MPEHTERSENTERSRHRDTETLRNPLLLCVSVSLWLISLCAFAGSVSTVEVSAQPQAAVQDLGHGIYAAIGVAVGTGGGAEARRVAVPQSNTFLVTTPDGSVVIDTSGPAGGAVHQPLLGAVSAAPVKAIIPTHGHGEQTGGVARWLRPGVDIITHRDFPEFLQYQRMLAGFFGVRNAAQFGPGASPSGALPPRSGAAVTATPIQPTR